MHRSVDAKKHIEVSDPKPNSPDFKIRNNSHHGSRGVRGKDLTSQEKKIIIKREVIGLINNSERTNLNSFDKPDHRRLVGSDSRNRKFRIGGDRSPKGGKGIFGVGGQEQTILAEQFGRDQGSMLSKGLREMVFKCENQKKKGKGRKQSKHKDSHLNKINMNDYLLKSYGFN